MHQAVDVVEGTVVQGPVQPAQVPDHQLVSVEYAQAALAMLPHFREDTQRGPWDRQEVRQQGSPTQPHEVTVRNKRHLPAGRWKVSSLSAILRKAGWRLGTGGCSGVNGWLPGAMSMS